MAYDDEDKKKTRGGVAGEGGEVPADAVEEALDAEDDEDDPMMDAPEGDDDKWE
jgi:hypothetical protein